MKHGILNVAARGEREILITRDFNAPRELVFDAMTKPELIRKWLGVFGGWTMDECEVDLRVGGTFRYLWRGPDGATMGMRGVYREIVVPERIVNTEIYDDPWYEGGAVETMVLTEQDGRTMFTSTVLYDSRETRDAVLKSPMEEGMAAVHNQLDEVLASITGAPVQ